MDEQFVQEPLIEDQLFGLLLPGKPIMTSFQQVGPECLELYLDLANEIRYITVFPIAAPLLQQSYGYSVYFQHATSEPCCVGQLNTTCFSVSENVSSFISNQDIGSGGRIYILIEPFRAKDESLQDSKKLSQVGVKMLSDFEKYVSSFNDVYHEGTHYVNYQVFQQWMSLIDQRIKHDERFWKDIE